MKKQFPLHCRPLGSFTIPQFGGKPGLLAELQRYTFEVYSPVPDVQQFEPSDTYTATWVCPDCLCEAWGPQGTQRGCDTCGNGAHQVTEHSTCRGPDFEAVDTP